VNSLNVQVVAKGGIFGEVPFNVTVNRVASGSYEAGVSLSDRTTVTTLLRKPHGGKDAFAWHPLTLIDLATELDKGLAAALDFLVQVAKEADALRPLPEPTKATEGASDERRRTSAGQ